MLFWNKQSKTNFDQYLDLFITLIITVQLQSDNTVVIEIDGFLKKFCHHVPQTKIIQGN